MLPSHLFLIQLYVFFISISRLLAMGNCLTSNVLETQSSSLPVDTIFNLPSPLPTWPPGDGFASGEIDLGGLKVRQISSLDKIWASYEGGPDNLGATFFEPPSIPGYSMLGGYAQPNNKPLFGWVLVGKVEASGQTDDILTNPTDYTLVWTSESLQINQSSPAYVWLPTPPDGYKPVGYVVTTTPAKPSLDKIRCVHSNYTEEYEVDNWIWAQGENGVNVYDLRPKVRGTQAQALSVGTFTIQNISDTTSLSLSCLKNNNFDLSSMPNPSQIEALFQTYSPLIYFHPKEKYLPSSVNWFFNNGALLYTKGQESDPIPIQPNGTNLPQGGENDGSYWLDLPVDDDAKDKVKAGDISTSEAYLHIKPMLGGTFTDIQVWLFYPFNGHAIAKLGPIDLPLGKIGEHVGDWEHVTLRISNFDGVLHKVYFAEHSGGTWIDASSLEFQNDNKFVAYSSLNGHASYNEPGTAMQGSSDIGIRNDTAKSDMVMDTGERFLIVAAENINPTDIVEPQWLNYTREWGPKISYKVAEELEKVGKLLIGKLKSAFKKLEASLPAEVYGEEGPTGPKMKNSWSGDEK